MTSKKAIDVIVIILDWTARVIMFTIFSAGYATPGVVAACIIYCVHGTMDLGNLIFIIIWSIYGIVQSFKACILLDENALRS
jgi:hypothetical protein